MYNQSSLIPFYPLKMPLMETSPPLLTLCFSAQLSFTIRKLLALVDLHFNCSDLAAPFWSVDIENSLFSFLLQRRDLSSLIFEESQPLLEAVQICRCPHGGETWGKKVDGKYQDRLHLSSRKENSNADWCTMIVFSEFRGSYELS